jgi:hypothetical protein
MRGPPEHPTWAGSYTINTKREVQRPDASTAQTRRNRRLKCQQHVQSQRNKTTASTATMRSALQTSPPQTRDAEFHTSSEDFFFWIVAPYSLLEFTHVSEGFGASIIRAMRQQAPLKRPLTPTTPSGAATQETAVSTLEAVRT